MSTASPERTALPLLTVHQGGRSAMTCHFKCDDACSKPVPNQTDHGYFGDLVAAGASRRAILKGSGLVAAVVGLGTVTGVQSAAVRSLHLEGAISTAATGTILALMADIADWRRTGPERRRLAAVLASLFAGAVAGGLLVVHANAYAPLLPLAIAVAVVTIAANRFGAT